jgi:predicted nucleotidyltransferase
MQAKIANLNIEISYTALAEFCEKWNVTEFAVFGSVLRADFRPDSDVDVLVTFSLGARRGLFMLADMQQELSGLFRRRVDLGTRDGVEQDTNAYRRNGILRSAEVIYAASGAIENKSRNLGAGKTLL